MDLIRFREVQCLMTIHDSTCNRGIGRFLEHIGLQSGARFEGMPAESYGIQTHGHSRFQTMFLGQMRLMSQERCIHHRPQRSESREQRIGWQSTDPRDSVSPPPQNTNNGAGRVAPSRAGPMPKLCRDPQLQGDFPHRAGLGLGWEAGVSVPSSCGCRRPRPRSSRAESPSLRLLKSRPMSSRT
jgi:hypothetical protein